MTPSSIRFELMKDAQRKYVTSRAAGLGLVISRVPGGYHLTGKNVDLLVIDLYYVNDADLSHHH